MLTPTAFTMDMLHQDLRYAVRTLRRSPAFTTVAVLTLALGIGAATALFSVTYGVLLRRLPYPEPERIVQLWQINEQGGQAWVSDPNFADWVEQSRGFVAMAQFQPATATVITGDEPVRTPAARVSRDFFAALGVQPIRGRGFLPEEQHEGAAPAAVVGHAFWQRHLGGDPNLAGKTLAFDDEVYTVVGVMPPGFDFPAGAELWTPRELRPVLPSRTAHNWQVVARLRDGVTPGQAQQELSMVSRRLKQQYGDDTWMEDAAVVPLHEQVVGRVRPMLLVLLGASAFLLLVAGANVANLVLARMTNRQHELAVRAALGASRWRLARQTLAESLVLALAGGVLGVLLAVWGVRALLAWEPGNLPRTDEIGIDPTVLGFALGVAVLVAALLGLAAALRAGRAATRGDLVRSPRSQAGGASRQRTQGGLVMAQVALTLVLLVGAGLLARTLYGLHRVDTGFRTEDVLTIRLTHVDTADDLPRLARAHDELIARLGTLPGVAAAGGIQAFPLIGDLGSGAFVIQHHPDEVQDFDDFGALMKVPGRSGYAAYRVASDGYFAAMGIPLLRGRGFDARDDFESPHVALISETLARGWSDGDAIGALIQFGNMDGDLRPMTVVGVVADVREAGADSEPQPTVYALHRQRAAATEDFTYVLHAPGGAAALVPRARSVVRELVPDAAPRLRTIEEIVAVPLAPRRFSLLLLGVFGGAALLLAALGVYGITAYSVAQRTREIGVRMALGAQPGNVLGLLVRQGAVIAGLGVMVGSAVAIGLTRLIASQLHGIDATDPSTFVAVAALLIAVTLAASYLPARRATRVDPMIALRAE